MKKSRDFSLQSVLDEINRTKEHYNNLEKQAAKIHKREDFFTFSSKKIIMSPNDTLKKQVHDIEAKNNNIQLPSEFLSLKSHDLSSVKWHLPAFSPGGDGVIKDNKDKVDLYRELLLNQLPNVKLQRSRRSSSIVTRGSIW